MTNSSAPPDLSALRCWVISEGHAGMENQCLGLAEALGFAPEIKRAQPRRPWVWLPATRWCRPLEHLSAASDPLEPPWPDLLIACGNKGAGLAAAIRQASGGRTYTVSIQDSRVPPEHFDLVAVPRHDRLRGTNVVVTRGTLHRVTPERLAAEAERFRARLAQLPRPLLAVLIGGTSRHQRFDLAAAARLGELLAEIADRHDVGLLVTTSRRTGADCERAIRDRLKDAPAWIWNGTGENPYFAFLGLADWIAVTSDSNSMLSEACATGKPVYVIELAGGSLRWRSFYQALYAEGVARPFTGALERWTYPPLDDTARVAHEVRLRLALHLSGL